MKIELTELLREVGNTADIHQSESISYPEDSLILVKPIEMDLQLTNAGDLVLLRGRVKTAVELECSRCSNKFSLPLDVAIEEDFANALPSPGTKKKRGEKELHAEDFISPIAKDNTIDISEIIRQNLLLALPIRPLCSENCPGQKG